MLRSQFWAVMVVVVVSFMHLPRDIADLSSDRQALLDFAAAVPHPRGRKLNWNAKSSSSSVCRSWTGVTCTVNSTRVLELRLPGVGFYGPIPANTLGRLDALASLSLRSNRLSGSLPSDILSLPSLRYIYLQHNNISGDIPITSSPLSPQLTFIDLSFNSFTGNIPNELFSNLTLLNGLNLQNNLLMGPIPDQLGQLPSLKLLNLSNNNLNGSIPPSLQRFPVSSFQGNPLLCGRPLNQQCTTVSVSTPAPSPSPLSSPSHAPLPPPNFPIAQPPSPTLLPLPPASQMHKAASRTKLSAGAIVPIAVGTCALLFLLVLVTLLCCRNDNKKKDAESSATAVLVKVKPKEEGEYYYLSNRSENGEKNKLVFFQGGGNFDLEDLLRASAEVLGKGTYGTTYKAVLEDGAAVAVKRLKEVAVVGRREFEQHMDNIWRFNHYHHPNIVSLRAYYYSKDEKLLVYDFLPFGSLSTSLHGNRESGRGILDWESRVKISLGAARGIAHIHCVASQKLTHGNIKSSNILLTQDFSGCISDFGITPLVGLPSNNTGYRAPEVSETRKFTQMSDVYSFGVVLLEMLTGKVPVQSAGHAEVAELPRWVQSVVREEWTAEVFDTELLKFSNLEEEMLQMLEIAMACVEKAPYMRPRMDQVVAMIQNIRKPDSGKRTSSGGG